MNDFISEDDLKTFEGWTRYQGVDVACLAPDELRMWQDLFAEAIDRSKNSPKVGLMKLQRVVDEQKYGVALRDGNDLWLTYWVRCNRKGEVFGFQPRGDRAWNPHVSYHEDGRFHTKSHGRKHMFYQRQPIATFKGSEHLDRCSGHGKSTGAVCDPDVFDGLLIVVPGVLGPYHGKVGVDLIEPGYEEAWGREIASRYYFGAIEQRRIFPRAGRPSVSITVERG